MIENNTLMYQADCDRCWASMRRYQSQLKKMIKRKEELGPIDFILFFQCLTLIIVEITLHEKYILNVDEKTKKFFNDDSLAGSLKRTIKEVECWKLIENKEVSVEKKINTIDVLRKNIWITISYQKDKLIDLMQCFPHINEANDFILLVQCVSTVISELELKELELDLLGINNFMEEKI